MKIIEGFTSKPGTLCISTALKNLCNYLMGHNYDEEIYYGMGSGLFFAYSISEDMAGIGGFAGDLIMDSFCDNLTAKKITVKTSDDCFDKIKFCIDNNFPILVNGLDFHSVAQNKQDERVVEELKLPMNYHFTMIVGYDEETEELRLADHRATGNVPMEVFKKLRDVRNEFYYILLPNKIENMESRIYRSISKTCDYWFRMPENPKIIADNYTGDYLHLSCIHNTMEGLNSFHDNFLRGVEMDNLNNFKKSMFFLRYLSYRGTGGDMTRGLYSRFLKQAAIITKNDKLNEAAKMYGNAAKTWRAFFKLFEVPDEILYEQIRNKDENMEFFQMIDKLYEIELEAVNSLKGLVE